MAWLAVEDLEPLVDRDPRAKDGRELGEAAIGRQVPDVAWIGQHVFCIASVDGVARHLLPIAQGFPAGDAVLAVAAGGVQPRHTDAVAFLHMLHASAHGRHMPHAFVARYEGR